MPFVIIWLAESLQQYESLKANAQRSLQNRLKNKRAKSTRDEGLFKQVHKCITTLSQNPRHPGLNTHEFDSLEHPYRPSEKVFEAYAQNQTPGVYRVFWCYGPEKHQLTIIAITPHP
jgi:hypothetical protein